MSNELIAACVWHMRPEEFQPASDQSRVIEKNYQ